MPRKKVTCEKLAETRRITCGINAQFHTWLKAPQNIDAFSTISNIFNASKTTSLVFSRPAIASICGIDPSHKSTPMPLLEYTSKENTTTSKSRNYMHLHLLMVPHWVFSTTSISWHTMHFFSIALSVSTTKRLRGSRYIASPEGSWFNRTEVIPTRDEIWSGSTVNEPRRIQVQDKGQPGEMRTTYTN